MHNGIRRYCFSMAHIIQCITEYIFKLSKKWKHDKCVAHLKLSYFKVDEIENRGNVLRKKKMFQTVY